MLEQNFSHIHKEAPFFGEGVGVYIHIPFCKQACHYCDFHFSTKMDKKEAMVSALKKELQLRKDEFKNETVETIYFGGGTPSVLSSEEINSIIQSVYKNFQIAENPEITLEANPDDLSEEKIKQLASSPINRLSIGVQSFFEEDLKLINRAHNALEAENCIREALKYFDNISIDLIYGMPNMSKERWQQNIEKAIAFNIPHISSYALTVEPKTALASFVKKGSVVPATDAMAQEHFNILNNTLTKAGFRCYEISNFSKPGYFSKNNTAYWLQKKYIGIGPSAHSFNGVQRAWNTSNNIKYIAAIENDKLPMEFEVLSKKDKYNEYIMTGLRTIWGVSIPKVKDQFGDKYSEYLLEQAQKYIDEHLLFLDGDSLITTQKGKFLADGIASNLFMLNSI